MLSISVLVSLSFICCLLFLAHGWLPYYIRTSVLTCSSSAYAMQPQQAGSPYLANSLAGVQNGGLNGLNPLNSLGLVSPRSNGPEAGPDPSQDNGAFSQQLP